MPPSSHQQASALGFIQVLNNLTGEERRWELQMRSSCTLPSSPQHHPTQHTQRWARGWIYSKKTRGKTLQSTCLPSLHHSSLLTDLSQPATQVLLYSQNGRGDLPSLFSKPTEKASGRQSYSWQLLLGVQQSGDSWRLQARAQPIPRAALAVGEISFLTHLVTHSSSSSEEWHYWPEMDALPG